MTTEFIVTQIVLPILGILLGYAARHFNVAGVHAPPADPSRPAPAPAPAKPLFFDPAKRPVLARLEAALENPANEQMLMLLIQKLGQRQDAAAHTAADAILNAAPAAPPRAA